MRKCMLVFLLLVCAVSAFAQDAKAVEILQKADDKISAYGTVDVDFGLHTDQYDYDCNIVFKEDRFKLDYGESHIWYDGKTMWSYNRAVGEVNVTEPDYAEICLLNPYTFLKNWKTDFSCEYKGMSGGCYEIRLMPEKDYPMKEASIYIRSTDGMPERIVITDPSGNELSITAGKYSEADVADSFFVFPADEYAGVEIVDLR